MMMMMADVYHQYVTIKNYLHDRMNHLKTPTTLLLISIDNDVLRTSYDLERLSVNEDDMIL
jgi:hypothetical protein